ncbi:flagellar export chaperone FliS [Alteromonas hispanica]|uniref:Flagellar secretion chaperone FliS n=1 Tax=Alteromonas hispanica TaxID=315421 RepID=A0A6L9MR89_9ALTE|nr:flagellar export chaperone FliS [Alteromonas hispanica]NDW20642.1 flagellar export chaperone FliS [Alteromonas hispanica]
MSLKGINAYKKGNLKEEVATADPHKLTLMLMQGSLDRIAYAKGAMERKDFVSKAEYISKASSIILHLRDTLDREIGGEFAENLFALYDYFIDRLNYAHVNNEIRCLDEVYNLLSPIKDAWAQIPQEAKLEAFEKQGRDRAAM